MSATSQKRAEDFLKISEQFQLGALTTETSHPITANLSETAKHDVPAALRLLFDVDEDVVRKYREFVESGRAQSITGTLRRALKDGGKIFFTGCGSTGRLSIQLVSIWRDFSVAPRLSLAFDTQTRFNMWLESKKPFTFDEKY